MIIQLHRKFAILVFLCFFVFLFLFFIFLKKNNKKCNNVKKKIESLEIGLNRKSTKEIEIMTAQIDSLLIENERLNNENQTLKKNLQSLTLFFFCLFMFV